MFELSPFTRRNSLAAYDPFREIDQLQRAFFGDDSPMRFSTDIRDMGNEYRLEAELPGFRKQDISIDVNGDYLTVSAQRTEEKNEKDKNGGYIHRERSYGSFRRSFDVSGVDTDAISAAYKDGVLTLTMPKKQSKQPAARRLEIGE